MESELDHMPLGRRLGMIAQRFVAVLYKRLSHLDMGPYFFVLVIIDKCNETYTQQEIANTCGLDKTNVLRIIDSLSDRGLIKRTQKKDDRRAYIIKITEKGRKILPEIYQAVEDLNSMALAGLSERQISTFYKTLEAIKTNISELPAESLVMSLKNSKK